MLHEKGIMVADSIKVADQLALQIGILFCLPGCIQCNQKGP